MNLITAPFIGDWIGGELKFKKNPDHPSLRSGPAISPVCKMQIPEGPELKIQISVNHLQILCILFLGKSSSTSISLQTKPCSALVAMSLHLSYCEIPNF